MNEQLRSRLYGIFRRRHAVAYLNFATERKKWNDIVRELGVERRGWSAYLPAGYVDIPDPADPIGNGWLRMTEETAMRILTLGLP